MLKYVGSFFSQEDKASEAERNVEDKHANDFDLVKQQQEQERSLLARAMKVHQVDATERIFGANPDLNIQVTKEEVEGVDEAFLLHNVLTAQECQEFITLSEELGYTDAPISTGFNSASMMKDIRDNLRVMWEVPQPMLEPIFQRIASHIPPTIAFVNGPREWRLSGLNERLRFYRYDKDQIFRPHFDGCYRRQTTPVEQSHFTIIIYLNDGFEGGHTTFFPEGHNSLWAKRVVKQEKKVNPTCGMALVFRHTGPNSPLHEGSPHFTEGQRKYVLRSDIMYIQSE